MNPVAAVTGFVLLASLVFGGSSLGGLVPDAILALAGAVALPALAAFALRMQLSAASRWALVLLSALLVLPLLQLVPLPWFVWEALPGRSDVVRGLGDGARSSFSALSLSPASTLASFMALLPVAAIFVGTLVLGERERRHLAAIVVGFAGLSVLLGVVQLAGGPESVLRFYSVTSQNDPVGFFSSRNSFASLLYTSMALAAAFVTLPRLSGGRSRRHDEEGATGALQTIWAVFAVLMLLVCALLTRSRAGLLLGILAMLLGVAVVLREKMKVLPSRMVLIACGAALLLVIFAGVLASDRILPRLGQENIDSFRPTIWKYTLAAANAYFPFGSGAGTFLEVFAMRETPETVQPLVVNRAHNDYLEWYLEGGLGALLILIGGAVLFGYRLWRVWADKVDKATGESRQLMRAASVAALLILLHSSIDFVLRTGAVAGVLAFCLALMLPPAQPRRANALADESVKAG